MDSLDLHTVAADPFVQTGVLALIGALLNRVLLRRYPGRRLVFQFLFFLALTALLYHHDIVPYEVVPASTPTLQRGFVALAKIIWWINGAWVLTGFVRVFLIFERRPREGRLLQDIVVGTIYLSAVLSVVAYVFQAPVGTLIATSGVFAIILGLALQSTLSDVFSGIALNLSKAYAVGDWIVLDGAIEGRVVETGWRATHLLNASNDLVVLPNSGLAKSRLTNLSSPNRSHGVKMRVRLVPTMVPSAIADVMNTVLLSCNSIMHAPVPTVQILSLDGQAIEFELAFRVIDFSTAAAARYEVYDLIYRHALANGLVLASPAEAPVAASHAPHTSASRNMALKLLDAVPLFASLTEDEKETLSATMVRRTYRKGETLAAQGAKLNALMVIRSGVVAASRASSEGEVELSRLSPGDYFGEGGLLTGSGEQETFRALTFVVVYEVGQAGLATLMRDRPTMADEIGLTLSRRNTLGQKPSGYPEEADDEGSARWFVRRIKQLFEVPDD